MELQKPLKIMCVSPLLKRAEFHDILTDKQHGFRSGHLEPTFNHNPRPIDIG